MAVDNKKLVYLIDPFWQGEGINGKPLVAGYMCVYHAGTNTPYITYQNFDGTHNPFKIPLNNDGRATILAEPYYKYDCYLYDSFGNLACSRLNVQPQVGGDVSVSGFTEVWHDDTLSGEGTPESPLTVIGGGGSGKTYEGIDPIVVNNDEDKISANTVPFGVQEPLYFVEDETATVIGISGNPSADAVNWVTAQNYLRSPDLIGYATKDFVEEEVSGKYDTSAFSTISGAFLTAVPEGSMNESAFGYSGDLITSYNGSAFKAGDEFPESATEAILVVTANSGKWNDTFTALTSNSGAWNTVTGKLDATASGNFQTTAGMTAYASKDDVSGLQSASVWNDAVNTVSSNSASWTGIEYTGVSPIVVDNTSRSISADTWAVTFGSGLSAIDDMVNSATMVVVTAQGGASMPITGTATVDGINYSGSYAADQATVMRLNSTGGTAYAGGFTPLGFSATGGTSPKFFNYVGINGYFLERQGSNTTQHIRATVDTNNPGIVISKTASDNTVTSGLLDISSINSWNDVTATVSDNSASWASGGELPQSATEAIETVTAGSGYWIDNYNTVYNNSGNWEETRSELSANSSYWDGTYLTVNQNSASWAGGAGGDMFVSGLAYTTGGEISGYSGSAFASTDPTYELSAGDGISLTTGAGALTISFTGSSGNMDVAGLEYTTGGEISSYSGSAFASTDPTYELSAGDGILLTTGAGSLTIAVALSTGSI